MCRFPLDGNCKSIDYSGTSISLYSFAHFDFRILWSFVYVFTSAYLSLSNYNKKIVCTYEEGCRKLFIARKKGAVLRSRRELGSVFLLCFSFVQPLVSEFYAILRPIYT